MGELIQKIVIASSIVLAAGVAQANDFSSKFERIQLLLSDPYTVDRALNLADGLVGKIEDYELYLIAEAFAKSGSPTHAVNYASRLADNGKKYDIARLVIERGNPYAGERLLKETPPEYWARAINDLYAAGNIYGGKSFTEVALRLEGDLSEIGFEGLIWKYSDDMTRLEYAMNAAITGNPLTARAVAEFIKDLKKKYLVAEQIILSGNPLNGVELLKTMPIPYIQKGIEVLILIGNLRSAEILRGYLSK